VLPQVLSPEKAIIMMRDGVERGWWRGSLLGELEFLTLDEICARRNPEGVRPRVLAGV